jgi:enoyl-CoA hydratase
MHLGLIRRWRETPKPTIAAVQGACMAGGLMLAWACDFIVAADDSFFNDPLVPMGGPGMEYFAHAFEMPSRIAKEFLMMGNRMTGTRAYALGMVNRLVTRETLMDECLANTLAERPRFALALTKQACNFVDDIKGKRTAMDRVFGMHQLAHAHNRAVYGAAAISPPKKEKK